jgi:uncharacterized surface protein with fasciclin (FAS1) repeats
MELPFTRVLPVTKLHLLIKNATAIYLTNLKMPKKMNNKYIARWIILIPVLVLTLLMNGCYDSSWDNHVSQDDMSGNNLAQAISKRPELSIFYAILKRTNYVNVLNSETTNYLDLLKSGNSFTVFAPTNAAWAGIDTTNVDQLRKLVGSLIVYKSYFTTDNSFYKSIKTISGKNIFFDTGTQTFNGAKIISSDIRTGNGVIQITDKIVERRNNIWEYLSGKTAYEQYSFINSMNTKVMDFDKSVAIGVDISGRTLYDTVYKNINNFLLKYPIDNEDSLNTYIVVENESFNNSYSKYNNSTMQYFRMNTDAQTDSLTRFNVCQDYVFKGIVDITKQDSLTNADGVKVSVRNAVITDTYNCSNGRIYVVKELTVRLKDKFKPIKIEGENFTNAYDRNYVLTRYKISASGQHDVVLACAERQTDTLYRKTTGLKDSIVSKNYYINSSMIENTQNFYIEYKVNVNSANYDVYYVAYDDIPDHFDPTYQNFGVFRVIQKLYMSMPGDLPLAYGRMVDPAGLVGDNTHAVLNNYLGNTRCFVGSGRAGVKELTKLTQWNTVNPTQIISTPISTFQDATADELQVSKTGTLTMWLCNSARSTESNYQGLLFLDYILLVPRVTEE